MKFFGLEITKANRAQSQISREENSSKRKNTKPYTSEKAFKTIEVVNRCINLIVDSASIVTFDVKEPHDFLPIGTTTGGQRVAAKKLSTILNLRPNIDLDANKLWRLGVLDMLFEGAMYYYWDGTSLYHLPAANMEVFASDRRTVDKFVYAGQVDFSPSEIIYVTDNHFESSQTSQISGYPRIMCIMESLVHRKDLLQFRSNYFSNGTMLNLILETDQVLNKRSRQRTEDEISQDYNPRTGRSTVKILDNGLKAKTLSNSSAKDLSVKEDVDDMEAKVMMGLGVYDVLLKAGNNANVRPNIELFYYFTVMPIMQKVASVMETFFGYDIALTTDKIPALAPDRDKQATQLSALVNNGIMTGAEARKELRLEPLKNEPELDKIRIPQNVSGSATGVSGQEGGAPPKKEEE